MAIENAKWISRLDNPIEKEFSFFEERPTIRLSKFFDLGEVPEIARLEICGLGYYTVWINGENITDTVLNSDVTNYNQVVYYDSYEVLEYLQVGRNLIEVELGNGWYNPAPILLLGRYNVRKQLAIGKPCMICDLELDGQHFYSDRTWESGYGQILQNDLYIGEVYTDQEQEGTVRKTVEIPGPAGRLTPSFIPKIKRQEVIEPVAVEKNEQGWVLDFGRILSGQLAVTLSPNFLGELRLQYAEEIDEAGNLLFDSTISGRYGLAIPDQGIQADTPVIQQDCIYKTKQDTLVYSNLYTYHSFRYVQVNCESEKAPVQSIIAYPTYTDVAVISDFESSSPELNDLWQAALQTRLHNIHSYFEDCSRERLGYGGDTVALLPSHVATIDARELLKKVFLDFVHDQRRDGGITQTAPYVGIMTNGTSNEAGSLGWQLVLPSLAHALLTTYDESQFVEEHANALSRHLSYLLAFDYDYIKRCCLGDWGSIDETAEGLFVKSPDQEFCSAAMYVILLDAYTGLVEKGILREVDLVDVREQIGYAREQIVAEFYDPDAGQFASGSGSSYLFAIRAGLLPNDQKLYKRLIQLLQERQGIFPFGIFGMSWACELLADRGDQDLILNWLLRKEESSYLSMLTSGNGTLAEHFPGEETFAGSKNHAMFSSYSSWLMQHLVGIQVVGDQLTLQPYLTNRVSWIKGSWQTEYGVVTLERYGHQLTLVYPATLSLDDCALAGIARKYTQEKEGQIIITYEVKV